MEEKISDLNARSILLADEYFVLADPDHATEKNYKATPSTVWSNPFPIEPADVTADGGLADSPTLTLRAKYDSDPTVAVVSANYDATLVHNITAGGATPASQVDLSIGGFTVASLHSDGHVQHEGDIVTNDGNIWLVHTAVNQFESGRIRFSEHSDRSTLQGGYIHYDGSVNKLHIGVHENNNATIGDDLDVISISRANGAITVNTNATFSGQVVSNGGLENTVIGAVIPAAVTATTMTVNGVITQTSGTVTLNNASRYSNAILSVRTGDDANAGVIARANSATQSAPLFEAQNSAGSSVFTVKLTGIENTVIGATTPAAATFTIATIKDGGVFMTEAGINRLRLYGQAQTATVGNNDGAAIYYSSGSGSYPFNEVGHLIIQPRTSAARDVLIYTGNGTPSARLSVNSIGNIGFNTTDIEIVGANHKSIAFGVNGYILYGDNTPTSRGFHIARNTYYDGLWKYKAGDESSRMYFDVDGSIRFETASEGTIDTEIIWTPALAITNTADIEIEATKKLYFDGGSNTYIYETSDNVLEIVAGGSAIVRARRSVNTSHLDVVNGLKVGSKGTVYSGQLSSVNNTSNTPLPHFKDGAEIGTDFEYGIYFIIMRTIINQANVHAVYLIDRKSSGVGHTSIIAINEGSASKAPRLSVDGTTGEVVCNTNGDTVPESIVFTVLRCSDRIWSGWPN